MAPTVTSSVDYDFSDMHRQMQSWVDQRLLPCVATVVLHDDDVVDVATFGYMNMNTKEPLRDDAIYRLYSNTKPITSVALMVLYERGLFDLDDPIEKYIPAFADMRVLTDGATSLAETVPAELSITPRHLLSHTSGLSYGFVEPDSLIDRSYTAAGINPLAGYDEPLEDLCRRLGEFPLVFQPGTEWRYSFGTDVVARLAEVLTGQRFDIFLEETIFSSLDMVDTGFHVPEEKHERFVTMFASADPLDYATPVEFVSDHPRTGGFSKPRELLMGGGGLVSTLRDYTNFVRMLINGGEWRGRRIITEETLQLMRTNQLPEGAHVEFPTLSLPGTKYGLGLSVLEEPGQADPPDSVGEFGWGGLAGTGAFISPQTGVAGISFSQRMPASFHPYRNQFRDYVYASKG
ncbi:MAG: serine hydrolase domain-containing protein [Acidimicrobiia bacterium]